MRTKKIGKSPPPLAPMGRQNALVTEAVAEALVDSDSYRELVPRAVPLNKASTLADAADV